MRAFEVSPDERVLFALTHPDDELSVAAFLSRLVKQETHVKLIWTHSTSVREAESRKAMAHLGVEPGDLTFFSAADGHVVSSVQALCEPLRRILADFEPTRIVTHAFEQGHIDHDATNLLVNLCYDGAIYEAPFYHTYLTRFPVIHRFSDPAGEETTPLTDDERTLKKELVRMFPSQTIRRNVMVYELAQSLKVKKQPLFEYERLRMQTHKDFLTPNHPPSLAARVQKSKTWQRWEREAEAILSASSLP